jgi:hypothetical protein
MRLKRQSSADCGDEKRLAQLALRAAKQLRIVFPGFGRSALTPTDIRGLRRLAGVAIERRDSRRLYGDVSPDPGELRRLRLAPGLPEDLDRFVTAQAAISELFDRPHPLRRSVADVLALCALCGYVDEMKSGAEPILEALTALFPVEPFPTWYAAHFPNLFRVRTAVVSALRRLDARRAGAVSPRATDEVEVTAYEAGKSAHTAGDGTAARFWFRHARRMARLHGAVAIETRSYLASAAVEWERRRFDVSELHIRRAFGIAKRNRNSDLAGRALHDRAALCILTNRLEDAAVAARRAFRFYGIGHENVPRLVGDLAIYWMGCQHYDRALQLLEAVWLRIPAPASLNALGAMAVAAVVEGDAAKARRYTGMAFEAARSSTDGWFVADGMLYVAQAMSILHDWDRAAAAADIALSVALKRREVYKERNAREWAQIAELRSAPPIPAIRANRAVDLFTFDVLRAARRSLAA